MWYFLRRCFVFRPFRTTFLFILATTFVCQSLFVFYLLTKVPLKDGNNIPIELKVPGPEEPNLSRPISKCESLGKTALSAIKRAKTGKCKEELKDVACRLKNGLLTPERLPNYCLRKGVVPGSSLGCFLDAGDQQTRLLSGFGVKLQHLTIQKCIDLCAQSAFPYAGVRNGKECYCGTAKPSLENLLNRETYCNVPCDDHTSRQMCGGVDAVEILDTGVPSRESTKLSNPFPVTKSESVTSQTRIAFILTLNGRALRQVTRLLRIIYRPHHVYLIHVDGRQDYLFRSLLPLELKYSNIRLTRNRRASIWGGSSLLDVLLEALEQLLEMDSQWQFAFNLSESDFPLRSIEHLESLLAANPGRNFLKSHGRQTRQFIHKQGLDRVFHQCESRMWRIGDRTLPAGIRIDGGSDWIGITRELAQYATTNVREADPLLKGLKEVYRQTLLPAESFFHVLVLNSKFCSSYADNNLRMTLWRRSQGCLCQHRNVVDWCGCSPMVFRTGDWSQLTSVMAKSSFIHFARKFEAALDQSVMNRLEEQFIANKSLSYPGWDSYWENAYHSADMSPPSIPALLAAATSLARHALTLLLTGSSHLNIVDLTNNEQCSQLPSPDRIVSITSYFRLDHYQGDLILFGAGEVTQFEVLVKPLSKSTIMASGSPSPLTLTSLQVGSDYDPKEQVLRNRLGVLSSESKPVAIYRWTAGKEKLKNQTSNNNISGDPPHLIWFDPNDLVKMVQPLNVSEISKAGYQSLELDSPLAHGVWTAVVVNDQMPLAATEFLITPLVDSFPLPSDRATPDKALQEKWGKYLPSDGPAVGRRQRRRSLMMKGDARSEAVLDSLTAEFYAIQDVCLVNFRSVGSCLKPPHNWQYCKSTDWSSFSPDPKSNLP